MAIKEKYTFKQVQGAQKKLDVLWTVMFIDPIALPLTWVLANFTYITPNQVTLMSMALGIISALLFSQGNHVYLIVGAFCLQLSFFLDCVDGKLARLTHQETELGEKLEFIRDKITHILNLLLLSYGQFKLRGDQNIIKVAIIYFVLLSIYWVLYRPPLNRYFGKVKSGIFLGRISSLPSTVEAMAIVFFIGPILNQVATGLIIASVLLSVLILYRLLNILPDDKSLKRRKTL